MRSTSRTTKRPKRPGPGRPPGAPNALSTRILVLLNARRERPFRAREIATLLRETERELVVRAALRTLMRAGALVRLERGLFQAPALDDAVMDR